MHHGLLCAACRATAGPTKRLTRRLATAAAGVHASAPTKDELRAQAEAALSKFDEPKRQGKRFNSVGIQQISSRLHEQLFKQSPSRKRQPAQELVDLSRQHLLQHSLLGKNANIVEDIAFDLPKLQGGTLDEHFHKLGLEASYPYLDLAKRFATQSLPPKPDAWVRQSGWTRYKDGKAAKADYPLEAMLCFDVEVLYNISHFAVMACVASQDAWYAWLSPWLLGESDSPRHLVPLGKQQQKLIVGHNVGYDRSKVLEEYSLKRSPLAFLDTMSLHVAVNGMCSRQRPDWMKHKKTVKDRERVLLEQAQKDDLGELIQSLEPLENPDLWITRSSTNSLHEVAQFHCDIKPDKSKRAVFDSLDKQDVLAELESLLDYCATDVEITHHVYKKVLTTYLEIAPHPVSFSGLLHMNSMILPVNRNWPKYIESAERCYQELSEAVKKRLIDMAEGTLALKDQPDKYEEDPWLRQLDWTMKPLRVVKNKKTGEERVAKNQKMPGMPQWYRDLFPKNDGIINLTVRTRMAPILLRMNWEGHPLVWSDKYGWVIRAEDEESIAMFTEKRFLKCDMTKEKKLQVSFDDATYFKVPHKDGPLARVASPLAKNFVKYFEEGVLNSEFSVAKEALEMNAACSYWISARERITSQMVVWQNEVEPGGDPDIGIILPQTAPMGTVTRRATEATWMTASNAKKNRVGSELKSMVQAPEGYCFVGADVDSEELWIASLMGDAQFQMHGSTALGWMTLEGTKSAGTDLHSKTASILGISRGNAKIFNYGRIYGAGLKFAIQLLQQFNPSLSEPEAKQTAEALYAATKGVKGNIAKLQRKSFWRGGTESYVFNRLEAMADLEAPRTPVLGCGITEALMAKYLSPGSYLTSRVNWAIQSSGVDYLHLLITSMDYLIRMYGIDARMSITVHDEIRYLVAKKDADVAAFLLQVSNLWTRCMFSQQLGIDDLPQSCAFFSEVDVDHVLRKETSMDCVTPSNPTAIPPGKSLSISDTLDYLANCRKPLEPKNQVDLSRWNYTPREPVLEGMEQNELWFLQAQSLKETRAVIKAYETAHADKPTHA
jgi:DNA polymerase gamma 1